jgi:hypothetical protein
VKVRFAFYSSTHAQAAILLISQIRPVIARGARCLPRANVAENDFGNVIVEDIQRQYWRICPEDLSCILVSSTRADWDQLYASPGFQEDWAMLPLVSEATARLGTLGPGRKYCLKVPAILGGEYGGENLGTIDFSELISVSGDMAKQIADVPDGSSVEIRVV